MPLIALIDDRQTNRTIFTQLARELAEDIDILTFASAEEALETLRFRMPDLVITDYNMPGMNGAEFVERFRLVPNYADIPVIVITIHDERRWRLAALAAGATDFLNSPVDHLEFVTRARNLLNMRRHQVLLEQRIAQIQNQIASLRVSKAHAIQEANRHVLQVVNGLPALIHAVTEQGHILFCNEAYSAFSGRSKNTPHNNADAAGDSLSTQDRAIWQTGVCPPPHWQILCDKTNMEHRFLVHKSLIKDRQGRVQAILTSAIAQPPAADVEPDAPPDSTDTLPGQAHVLNLLYGPGRKIRRDDHAALHLVHWPALSTTDSPVSTRAIRTLLIPHLRHMLRSSDILARWDDTTLAVLQRQVSGPQDAYVYAQRLQAIIDHCGTLMLDTPLPHAAIGAALSHARCNPHILVSAARQALERAKETLSICIAGQDKNVTPLRRPSRAELQIAEPA